MAAPRDPRDVVRALLSAVPTPESPLVQATVASPAATGANVNVLLDPTSTSVTTVRRFSFVTAPTAGQSVWLIPVGRTYICLGTLA